jgi:hypothetical protein
MFFFILVLFRKMMFEPFDSDDDFIFTTPPFCTLPPPTSTTTLTQRQVTPSRLLPPISSSVHLLNSSFDKLEALEEEEEEEDDDDDDLSTITSEFPPPSPERLLSSSDEEEFEEEEEIDEPEMFLPQQPATQLMPAAAAADAADELPEPAKSPPPASLVSAKDIRIENYLEEIFETLTVPADTESKSITELARLWKEEVRAKLTEKSVTLSHKTVPLVQLLLEHKLGCVIDKTFVRVATAFQEPREMIDKYQYCFETWVDDTARVHFKAQNKRLLGNLTAQEVFILTFFAQSTNQRVENDNVLQLGIVGKSSSGKSTLFEKILMEGAHVTTNEKGVGRFQTGKKPLLMFQDIDIRTLTHSSDSEKIKTLARTEPTVTKIHGNTLTLPPLFIFYSSNERLMNHEFPASAAATQVKIKSEPEDPFDDEEDHLFLTPPPPPQQPRKATNLCWRYYASQVHAPGRKRISDDCLLAVQNRFIEAFVRDTPPLNTKMVPKSGGFQRLHGVLGMYPRIFSILEKHASPDEFYSPVLCQYVLSGLASNASAYFAITERNYAHKIIELTEKIIESPSLRANILSHLSLF